MDKMRSNARTAQRTRRDTNKKGKKSTGTGYGKRETTSFTSGDQKEGRGKNPEGRRRDILMKKGKIRENKSQRPEKHKNKERKADLIMRTLVISTLH